MDNANNDFLASTRDDILSEDLIREADGLFLGLLRNELVGIYIIQDDHFRFVNPRLAELFGYTQEELCLKMGPLDLTAPEHRPFASQEIERRVHNVIKSSRYFFEGIRKDGSRLRVEVFGTTTELDGRPAIIGIMIDNTHRHHAEVELEEQLHFIVQLIDAIPNPIFYKDELGRYLGCNRAFEQFVGSPRHDLIGKSVYELSPKDLADRYYAADKSLFDNPGVQNYESVVKSANGERRDVMFNKATFNKSNGSLGGLVGIILDITERKNAEEALWNEANYDHLTKLPNRRLFLDRLKQELMKADRSNKTVVLMFIDLDRFKEVNDTLGHEIGDQLLLEAASRITSCVRMSDTVARLGGDEFTIILPDISNPDHVEQVANSIIHSLKKPFYLGVEIAYVSASIGITYYPKDAQNIDTLLINADQAMYNAKENGKNRFSYFLPSMQLLMSDKQQIGNDLRVALEQDQLEVHYQPILELDTGHIVKAEALLRWKHPKRGDMSPSQFIPIAEDLGLINEIGDWVFKQAVETAKRWDNLPRLNAGHQGEVLQINVNKSPRQFFTGNTHETWIEHLHQAGLTSEHIGIEITEGLLLDERPEVSDKLLQFHDAGIQLSLDDFGTGYSAMSYLKRFDIDILKIDRSFINDMASDKNDRAIVEAIIAMAHKLDIKVVAEGIETKEQLDLLISMSCDYGQGFLFSRAVPEQEFKELL